MEISWKKTFRTKILLGWDSKIVFGKNEWIPRKIKGIFVNTVQLKEKKIKMSTGKFIFLSTMDFNIVRVG